MPEPITPERYAGRLHREEDPLSKLLSEILLSTLEDVQSPYVAIRRKAIAWVRAGDLPGDRSGFTFDQCCRHFRLRPEAVASQMLRLPVNASGRRPSWIRSGARELQQSLFPE